MYGPGSLKYADLNDDGMINDIDRPENGLVMLLQSQNVYIADANFMPTYY